MGCVLCKLDTSQTPEQTTPYPALVGRNTIHIPRITRTENFIILQGFEK